MSWCCPCVQLGQITEYISYMSFTTVVGVFVLLNVIGAILAATTGLVTNVLGFLFIFAVATVARERVRSMFSIPVRWGRTASKRSCRLFRVDDSLGAVRSFVLPLAAANRVALLETAAALFGARAAPSLRWHAICTDIGKRATTVLSQRTG